MKILYVVNELPSPPRNGVTIPSYNYLKWCHKLSNGNVDLLYLPLNGGGYDDDQLEENRQICRRVIVAPRHRLSTWRRIKDELVLVRPAFHGYRIDDGSLKVLKDAFYDIIIFTPISAVIVREKLDQILPKPPCPFLKIALVNDCVTAMFHCKGRYIFRSHIPLRIRLNYLVEWLRSFLMGKLEYRILAPLDLILCQTPVDKKWFNRISKGKLEGKIMNLSNGVDPALFTLPLQPRQRKLLFVGSLYEYSDTVIYIIRGIWPRIKASLPDVTLIIVGKGPTPLLKRIMAADSSIDYIAYVKDLKEVYADAAVMLSPIFKGFGLINKVVEAMASGVVVVGDKAAVNGIPGFLDGRHGVIDKTPEGMANAAVKLFRDEECRLKYAIEARNLVEREFSWETRFAALDKRMERLLLPSDNELQPKS